MKCYWHSSFGLKCDRDLRTYRDDRGQKIAICGAHRAWEHDLQRLISSKPQHPDGSTVVITAYEWSVWEAKGRPLSRPLDDDLAEAVA